MNTQIYDAPIRDIRDGDENHWTSPTVAAVGPRGEFILRHLRPGTLNEVGDSVIFVRANGSKSVASIEPRYADRGWCLYEDMCAGRVDGVAADPDAWQRWLGICKIRAAGQDPRNLNDTIFHSEVIRRRAQGGLIPQLNSEELMELLPGVTLEGDAPGDAKATKATKATKGGA